MLDDHSLVYSVKERKREREREREGGGGEGERVVDLLVPSHCQGNHQS